MIVVLCAASAAVIARDAIDASNANPEASAARVPLEHYLKGHVTGDGALIHKAFHPTAKIMSFRDGKLNALTVDEFATRFAGKPASDEAQRKRRIQSIGMAGNAAAATIDLEYPTTIFTDYMSLLKVDGGWKILNKNFHAEPRTGM